MDTYREWAPPSAWKGVVVCCWEQHVTVSRVQRVLPDGCADILIYPSGSAEVVGVADTAALPVLEAGTRIRGVRLRPEAVGASLRTDAASLRNITVPLSEVLGSRQAQLVMYQGELDRWIRSIVPDARAKAAVCLLREHDVSTAADQIALSARHLQRVMLTQVGVTPKTYQRVVRFRRFLRMAEGASSLAIAAAQAGYVDQAHLSHESQQLSGLSPGRLLASRRLDLSVVPEPESTDRPNQLKTH